MKIREGMATALCAAVLEERKVLEKNAFLQASVLVSAEMKGHPSHGLQRLPRLVARIENGLADPKTTGHQSWQSANVLKVDGERGLGPVVMMAALDTLCQRMDDAGIALAAIGNSNHLGMLAFYVEEAARRGFIAIAMTTSEALVYPYGGTRAMLGTNPLAIAVPTAEAPMVLDLATSAVAMGKVHHYAAAGRPIPEGWARDAEGRPTTDAGRAKDGSIAPFGGGKGYGLGLAIELVVAALAGSALAPDVRGTLDAEAVCNKGDVLILMRPDAEAGARLSAYLEAVRASPPANPEAPVLVPGDRARASLSRAEEAGFEIDPGLWASLQALSITRSSEFEGHVR